MRITVTTKGDNWYLNLAGLPGIPRLEVCRIPVVGYCKLWNVWWMWIRSKCLKVLVLKTMPPVLGGGKTRRICKKKKTICKRDK